MRKLVVIERGSASQFDRPNGLAGSTLMPDLLSRKVILAH